MTANDAYRKRFFDLTPESHTVTDIASFKAKYGRSAKIFAILLSKFINNAPEFPGDAELAKGLGEAMADLQDALQGEEESIKDD